jgi:hypothetical protein
MSLRHVAGALVYDLPRYLRSDWRDMRNRDERVATDGRGVRCEWEFTSELHIANVFPSLGARLMKRAFAEWPIAFRDAPDATDAPDVSFVIGHRGMARLPQLLATLRAIAGQTGAKIECIVVEQSVEREIESRVPSWVRYIHTPVRAGYDYNRAWTLNAGVAIARGRVVILHDNDIIVPARYAAEALSRVDDGFDFLDLKRFTFYLDEAGRLQSVIQNLQGATIAASRDAYLAIGGFDEEFVGWGGEDNEFWERAQSRGRTYQFGYLPFLHQWHAPQPGKLQGASAPALQRYHELRKIAPEERIRRLRDRAGV